MRFDADTTTVLVLAMYATLLAGCAEPLPSDQRAPAEPASRSSELPMAGRDSPANPVQLASTVLAPAIADLAARTGSDQGEIMVRRAMPVIWNDGAAGCPEPGVAYTQALVPGYWAVLEHKGRYYSYHAAGKGGFRLCTGARVGPDDAPPHGRYNNAV